MQPWNHFSLQCWCVCSGFIWTASLSILIFHLQGVIICCCHSLGINRNELRVSQLCYCLVTTNRLKLNQRFQIISFLLFLKCTFTSLWLFSRPSHTSKTVLCLKLSNFKSRLWHRHYSTPTVASLDDPVWTGLHPPPRNRSISSLSFVVFLYFCLHVSASADPHKSYHTWRAGLTTCELLGQCSQSFSCSELQTNANLAFSQRLSNMLGESGRLAGGR